MQKIKKKNSGFTLVELIVVLVILAILCAVLVPALLGYIDRAKEKQYILNAKNCLTAAQAELSFLYAKNGDKTVAGTSIVSGSEGQSQNNGDYDVTKTKFAEKVLANADMAGDKAPYCFMIGVGSNHSDDTGGRTYNVTAHDKYTVYYTFYMEKADSAPLYYYNGEWTKTNPRAEKLPTKIFDDRNIIQSGPQKGLRIQYYLISNKTGIGSVRDRDFWNWLKSMI